MTIWKDIRDFPDYQISDDGQVRTKKGRKEWYVMKTRSKWKNSTNPYDQSVRIVDLRNRYGRKTCKVHRLIAEAFLDKPDPDHYLVDHIDGNASNNHISNLRWATPSQNTLNGKHKKENDPWLRFHNGSWCFEVCINGKIYRKSFSCKKYGDEVAKDIAIGIRNETIKEMGFIHRYNLDANA